MPVRLVEVRLEATGAGTFRQQYLAAAGAVEQVGRASVTARGEVSTMGRSMQALRDIAKGAVSSMLGFTAANVVMSATSRAVRAVKDDVLGLDQALVESTAIMGDVSSVMRDDMEAAARSLAVQFGISAGTIAQAFYFLASAGLNAEQSIAALPQVVAFAKAGAFDLETAVSLAADAQTAMGLRSADANENLENLTRTTDVLVEATRAANANTEQFSEALTNKAAAAGKAFGIEIEEVVATLAAFADTGVKGRRAGEAFSIMLRELTNHSAELADVGVTVFDAAGELLPLNQILAQLEQALDGLSDKEKTATLAAAGFSDEGKKMILQILGTSDAIAEYTTRFQAAGGATQEVAENQMRAMAARIAIVREQMLELARLGFDKLVEFGGWLRDEFGPAFESLASAIDTAAETAAPFVKAFAGGSFLAVKAALSGIADTLEVVAGFLEDNETLVQVLTVALLSRLLIALVATGSAAVRTGASFAWTAARGHIAAAAFSLASMNFEMRSTPGLLGKMGVAARGFGSILSSLLSPAMLLTLGLFGVYQILGDISRQAEQFSQEWIADLKVDEASVRSLENALDKTQDRIVEFSNTVPTSGAGEFLVQWAENSADVFLSIFGAGGVIDSNLEDFAELRGLQDAQDTLEKQIANMRRNLIAAFRDSGYAAAWEAQWGTVIRIQGDAIDSLIAEFPDLADVLPEPDPTLGDSIKLEPGDLGYVEAAAQAGFLSDELEYLGTVARVAGLDLQSADFGTELAQIVQATSGLPPAAQATEVAFMDVADAANFGTEKVDAFADALSALFDQEFGLEAATDRLKGGLLDLADASIKTAEGGGKVKVAWDENTKEGIRFRDTARGVIEDLGGVAVEMAKNGASAEEIRGTLDFLSAGFRTAAEEAGVPPEIVQDLIDVLDQIPTDALDFDVDTQALTDTQTDIEDTSDDVDDLDAKTADPDVTLDTTDFDAGIARANLELDALDRRTANAPAPAPRTGNRYQDSVGGAAGMVLSFYEEGHIAQIAPAGSWRVWAEPETGGEAYIPLAPAKRSRSLLILTEVARRFGLDVVQYANGAISDVQNFENLVGYYAGTRRNTKSFATAQWIAASGAKDPEEAAQKSQAALMQMARTYTEVATTVSEAAADELANSGLVGQAYEEAARKIIQAEEEKKRKAEDAARERQRKREEEKRAQEQAAADQRRREDNQYKVGAVSTEQYLATLRKRLKGFKKYSDEWTGVWLEIQQIEQQQLDEQQARIDEATDRAQSVFDSVSEPFMSAVSLVGQLGRDASVTGSTVLAFLDHSLEAADKWADATQRLADAGLDQGVLEQLMQAGPQALPLAQALLDTNISDVNSKVGALGAAAASLGTAAVGLFGTPAAPATTMVDVGGIAVEVVLPYGTSAEQAAAAKTSALEGVRAAIIEMRQQLGQGLRT